MAQQGQSSRTKNRPLLQHIPYICRWHLGNSFVPWDIEKKNRMPPLGARSSCCTLVAQGRSSHSMARLQGCTLYHSGPGTLTACAVAKSTSVKDNCAEPALHGALVTSHTHGDTPTYTRSEASLVGRLHYKCRCDWRFLRRSSLDQEREEHSVTAWVAR